MCPAASPWTISITPPEESIPQDEPVSLKKHAGLSESRERKIEVYDWLRGLAALAVVFDHFKPFGLSNIYFVWSIQAFLLVTVVLISPKHLTFGKMAQKLAHVTFCYVFLFVVFWPLFALQDSRAVTPLWMFFFDINTVFIENPYFGHLWYLLIHAQLLVFLCAMDRQLKKWDARWVLIGALILSELSFTWTYLVIERFPTVLLSSWFLTLAAGFYWLPAVTSWIENHPQHRARRCFLSLMVLGALASHPQLSGWLILPDTRVSLLSTLIYFLCIYALMELFFVLNRYPVLNFIKRFVFLVSRYTLVIYIYHQGVGTLLAPHGVSAEFLTVFSILSGIVVGYAANQSFKGAQSFFKGMSRFLLSQTASSAV